MLARFRKLHSGFIPFSHNAAEPASAIRAVALSDEAQANFGALQEVWSYFQWRRYGRKGRFCFLAPLPAPTRCFRDPVGGIAPPYAYRSRGNAHALRCAMMSLSRFSSNMNRRIDPGRLAETLCGRAI